MIWRALRIFPQALVIGYANDYLGYFPTQTAIDEATYEALSSAFDARAHQLLAGTPRRADPAASVNGLAWLYWRIFEIR